MIDKNMIALSEIRNGYALSKYGNLTLEQNSLIKYDNLCLKLIEENQKNKEVIDKVKELITDNIEETTYEYIGSTRIKVLQRLIMDNNDLNELLDILNEVSE